MSATTIRDGSGIKYAFWLERTSGQWRVECTQRGRRIWTGEARWMRDDELVNARARTERWAAYQERLAQQAGGGRK
jgi:hypothetical protein